MPQSALSSFVGVYLDEDLIEAYVDEFDAADAFRREQPARAVELADEIDQLLASRDSESEILAELQRFGLNIVPEGGIGYREWLTQIARRVRSRDGDATGPGEI